MGAYSDWGKNKVDPNLNDFSWVDDLSIYPKTPVYRNQYKIFKAIIDEIQISPVAYLSLGTGLGRHLVIAKQIFDSIKEFVAIDNEILPHGSISGLGIPVTHLRLTIKSAIQRLVEEHAHFDFICFENVGHSHEISTEMDIIHLSQITKSRGILAIIGDTNIDSKLLIATGLFKRIPNETESWGDATSYNFWIRE